MDNQAKPAVEEKTAEKTAEKKAAEPALKGKAIMEFSVPPDIEKATVGSEVTKPEAMPEEDWNRLFTLRYLQNI